MECLSMGLVRVPAIFALAWVFVSPTGTARACSISACPDTYGAPADGQSIPANAPALFVRRGDGPDDESNGPIALSTRNGDPIAFVAADDPANLPSGRLLILSGSLPDGELRVQTNVCGEGSGVAINNVFTAGPPVALPAIFGSVVASAPFALDGSIGSCDINALIHPVGVSLALSPTASSVAYAGLIQLTLTVDGALWAKERYGRDPPSARQRKVDVVFTECATLRNPRADQGLDPGFHHAELSAHIAGVDGDLPPAGVDFQLTCPTPDGEGRADAGSAGGPETPGADSAIDRRSSGDGCRLASCAPATTSSAALGLLLALVATASRRR